jgi:uncharacterized lipoprotein YbaY
VVLGQATYRERIKMPPGAALLVELVAVEGAAPRVVARARKPDVAGPPIPFALPYDAAQVRANARYALRAELVGPDGERWFATPSPVAVVPGEGTSVELMLHRTSKDTTTPAAAATGSGPRHWECGDLGVMTRAGAQGLRIDANARTWTLSGTSSAGYADTSGNAFRDAGATARLTVDGEAERDCVPARQPAPWNEALLRGVAFRAVGNEPGWFVEVDSGEAPRLRATLDYGERRVEVTARRSASGFTGQVDGEPLRLDIARRACTDGMSGQRFEATATMQIGTKRYAGCGGWLAD